MIIQTNTFVCDFCGKIISQSCLTYEWADDDIIYPEGWHNVYNINGDNRKNACPDCINSEKDIFEGEYNFVYKKEIL